MANDFMDQHISSIFTSELKYKCNYLVFEIFFSWKKLRIQGVCLFLKSKVKICPSNLLIAPATRNLFETLQKSLIKNFVLKLSEPSTI